MKKNVFYVGLLAWMLCSCNSHQINPIKPVDKPKPEPGQRDSVVMDTLSLARAVKTFRAVVDNFWIEGENQLHVAWPHRTGDYYATHAAVWGYGSFLSAYNNIYQRLPEEAFVYNGIQIPDYKSFAREFEEKIWTGLEDFWNFRYDIGGYGAYINDWDGRLYDDNVWVGIDLIELYDHTKNVRYLNKAKEVWKFLMSGMDEKFGGGVYWSEEDKLSKNTCSNAPVAVFGMKLYKTTGDNSYRMKAAEIYQWTKKTLQNPESKLYWDNIKEEKGEIIIQKWEFSYNVGQMLQAAVLLYNSYKEEAGAEELYLKDAMELATAAYEHYFDVKDLTLNGKSFRMLQPGDLWFHAIMFRGYADLYNTELNEANRTLVNVYVDDFRSSLTYAWLHALQPNGLFYSDLSGRTKDQVEVNGEKINSIDLRYPSAITEMYARIATLNNK